MTFTDIIDKARTEHLMESSTSGHFTSGLMTSLSQKAARMMGVLLQVPRYSVSQLLTVAAGNVLPLSIVPTEVFTISFDGRQLRRVPLEELASYNASVSPRVFAVNEAQGVVQVAGLGTGSFTVNYFKAHDPVGQTNPWNNQYPEHHDLLVLKTAELGFTSSMEYEKAAAVTKLIEFELQALPVHLRPSPSGEVGEP